jgi:hypothetical protein
VGVDEAASLDPRDVHSIELANLSATAERAIAQHEGLHQGRRFRRFRLRRWRRRCRVTVDTWRRQLIATTLDNDGFGIAGLRIAWRFA